MLGAGELHFTDYLARRESPRVPSASAIIPDPMSSIGRIGVPPPPVAIEVPVEGGSGAGGTWVCGVVLGAGVGGMSASVGMGGTGVEGGACTVGVASGTNVVGVAGGTNGGGTNAVGVTVGTNSGGTNVVAVAVGVFVGVAGTAVEVEGIAVGVEGTVVGVAVATVAEGVGAERFVMVTKHSVSAPPPFADPLHWEILMGIARGSNEPVTSHVKPTLVPSLPEPLHCPTVASPTELMPGVFAGVQEPGAPVPVISEPTH